MNVLFLTHRLPYAPNRGDRIRAYYLLKEMSRFADVSLFSLVHDAEEESFASRVPFAKRVMTSRVSGLGGWLRGAAHLMTSRPLTHFLLDGPDVLERLAAHVDDSTPDVVLAYCSGMARFALEEPLSTFPFVLDLVDVDSRKWQTLGDQSGGPFKWVYRREARTLGRFETEAGLKARRVLVVNERERDGLVPELLPKVEVLPNGVDVSAFTPPGPPSAEPLVAFCGVMNYAPNAEGVKWFTREVWPKVRARRPDARFVIVGASPTRDVRALAERDSSIDVTGGVDAVQPYLWRAALSIAPLHVARGLQNKVLEALAAGLPTVTTSTVAEGLPAVALPGCVVAETADEFARATIDLLDESPERRRARANAAALSELSWPRQLTPLRRILEDARSHQDAF